MSHAKTRGGGADAETCLSNAGAVHQCQFLPAAPACDGMMIAAAAAAVAAAAEVGGGGWWCDLSNRTASVSPPSSIAIIRKSKADGGGGILCNERPYDPETKPVRGCKHETMIPFSSFSPAPPPPGEGAPTGEYLWGNTAIKGVFEI